MKRSFLLCLSVLIAFAISAQAQLFRVPLGAGPTIVRTSIDELFGLPVVQETAVKRIYALARAQFRQENNLLTTVPFGLVQIKLHNRPGVLGSGFLFEKDGHLFVGMAQHIGGRTVSQRIVQVFSHSGQPQEYDITINASGKAGWHAADISIAELPQDALKQGAKPLPIGLPQITDPIFSLGYTTGGLEHKDFVAIKGKLFSAEGYGLQSTRELIAGEDASEPFLFSGSCGSPLVQLQDGAWKVVGVSAGGCVIPQQPAGNKTFAINVSQVVPQLVDSYLNQIPLPSRGLHFKGWTVGRLEWTEQISQVQVWRDGNMVFEQDLYHYPGPYSDEHSEMALADFETHSGDEILYTIRTGRSKTRQAEFIIP